MTVIHEIQQVIYLSTPHGKSQALFIIDYGIHENTIWVAVCLNDGKIRHYDSNQVQIMVNHTTNLNNI